MKSINDQFFKQFAVVLTAIIAVIVVASGCSGLSGKSQDNYSGKVESITVGMEATPVNSLIYIADKQKYFAANGLRVTIKDNYPSGAAAVEDMLKGKVDVATAAELAIVRQALAKEHIQTVGTIDRFIHMQLIGRKDRGIKSISDLKGKKIGVPLKTAADFNLGRFLDLQGIDKNQISIVDVQAPHAVNALINGEVDAVVVWQPNVMTITDRLGDNASSWSVQNGQPIYCTAITADGWAKKHPDVVKRFLNSLDQADDYLVHNPSQARTIVQKRLHYDDRYIKTIWPEHEFSLRLDQSLVLSMEDEARWVINNNLTTETAIPDFSNYIYVDGLKEVKPEAVNIIR